MKPAISFLQVMPWLLAATLVSSAEQNEQGPKISPELVAKTVAWQVHWDQRSGVPNKAPSTLTFKMHNQSGVWIGELNWIISFAYEGSQPFPNFVQRLPELPNEVSQKAMLPFAQLVAATVKLPTYTNSFQKISTLKPDIQQKLLDAFKHEACSADMLALCKNQSGLLVKRPRYWIAPVDLNFPVLLYCVEGVPYIGKVYFDTHSLKALYSEFNYSGDEGTESRKCDLKLIIGIKVEGDAFDLKNGQLVKVKGEINLQ
jgi:hypothetical protein